MDRPPQVARVAGFPAYAPSSSLPPLPIASYSHQCPHIGALMQPLVPRARTLRVSAFQCSQAQQCSAPVRCLHIGAPVVIFLSSVAAVSWGSHQSNVAMRLLLFRRARIDGASSETWQLRPRRATSSPVVSQPRSWRSLLPKSRQAPARGLPADVRDELRQRVFFVCGGSAKWERAQLAAAALDTGWDALVAGSASRASAARAFRARLRAIARDCAQSRCGRSAHATRVQEQC